MSNNTSEYMSHTLESNCLVVYVKDRFDEKNCFQIQDNTSELLKKESTHLLLDLNEVKVIRSSGLRVILSIAKSFKNKDKSFAIVYSKNDKNYQVSQILEVSGFTKIVPIYPTKKEAIEHCSEPSENPSD